MTNWITTPFGMGRILAHDLDTDRLKIRLLNSMSLPHEKHEEHERQDGVWIDRLAIRSEVLQ